MASTPTTVTPPSTPNIHLMMSMNDHINGKIIKLTFNLFEN